MDKSKNYKWRKWVLWGFGILILAVLAISRILGPIVRKSGWDLLTTENSGIVNDFINAIAFDESGRAWIGTSEGVSVYDGESWQSYTTENSALGETGAWVREIEIGPEGRIWIGISSLDGSGGLNIVDGELWDTYSGSNSPLGGTVHAIAFDESERAWIGTGIGIQIYDGTTWISLDKDNSGLISDLVRAIDFDESGRAWIGTDKGISVYDGETWLSYTEKNSGIFGNSISAIGFDHLGNAWIGGYGGASFFDGESWITYHWEHSSYDYPDDVEAITTDSEGHILFMSESTLRIYDGEVWLNYNSWNSGLEPVSPKYDIVIGPEGRIWIASSFGVNVATVDNSGLPVDMLQKSKILNSFLNWGFVVIPIAILTLFWFAIYLQDIVILLVSIIVGATWLFNLLNPTSAGVTFFPGSLIFLGPFIGGIVGSFIRKFRNIDKLAPTFIGIVIGTIASIFLFIFLSFLTFYS